MSNFLRYLLTLVLFYHTFSYILTHNRTSYFDRHAYPPPQKKTQKHETQILVSEYKMMSELLYICMCFQCCIDRKETHVYRGNSWKDSWLNSLGHLAMLKCFYHFCQQLWNPMSGSFIISCMCFQLYIDRKVTHVYLFRNCHNQSFLVNWQCWYICFYQFSH